MNEVAPSGTLGGGAVSLAGCRLLQITTSGLSPLEGRPRGKYFGKCGGSKDFNTSRKGSLGQRLRRVVGRPGKGSVPLDQPRPLVMSSSCCKEPEAGNWDGRWGREFLIKSIVYFVSALNVPQEDVSECLLQHSL